MLIQTYNWLKYSRLTTLVAPCENRFIHMALFLSQKNGIATSYWLDMHSQPSKKFILIGAIIFKHDWRHNSVTSFQHFSILLVVPENVMLSKK